LLDLAPVGDVQLEARHRQRGKRLDHRTAREQVGKVVHPRIVPHEQHRLFGFVELLNLPEKDPWLGEVDLRLRHDLLVGKPERLRENPCRRERSHRRAAHDRSGTITALREGGSHLRRIAFPPVVEGPFVVVEGADSPARLRVAGENEVLHQMVPN